MINIGDIFVRKQIVGNNDDYKIILVADLQRDCYMVARLQDVEDDYYYTSYSKNVLLQVFQKVEES